MNQTMSTTQAYCYQYELEIAIDASAARVWECIFIETNLWWLPDFHVVEGGSVVTFDPQPGGSGLLETTPDGGGLLWYEVQMYLPAQFKVYLIGHVAPEWGGPLTSSLQLAVEPSDSSDSKCVLKVSDARHGKFDENQVQSYQEGWSTLFTDGLKKHAEKNHSG